MAYGGPDWLAARWPIRTTQGTNQARYIITAAGAIASGGTGTLDITVAAGKRQVFSLVEAMSPVSLVQEVDLSIDDTILWRRYYDIHAVIAFPLDSAPMLEAGAKFTVTVVNNHASTQTLRINVAGTIEDA